jgi:hypothetical protein
MKVIIGDLKAGWVLGANHDYEVVRNAEAVFHSNSIGTFIKGGAFRTYERPTGKETWAPC